MIIGSIWIITKYVTIMKNEGWLWESDWYAQGTFMENNTITLNYDNYAISNSRKNNLTGICKSKADVCFLLIMVCSAVAFCN